MSRTTQGGGDASQLNGCVPTGTVSRPRRTETSDLSEADAIRLAQQGDTAAFERIYRLHNRRVYALCLRMVGNTAEAEDLTQEAFLQLFRKIRTFRGESGCSTWLHRLAVKVALMRVRHNRTAVGCVRGATWSRA